MFRRWTNIFTLSLPIILVSLIACNSNSKIKGTEYILPSDAVKIKALEDLKTRNPDSALIVLNQEIEIHKNDVYKPFYLKLLSLLSQVYQIQHKYNEALEVTNKIIQETDSKERQYKFSFVFANYMKGDIYYELKNYPIAYKYYFIARQSALVYAKPCMIAQYDYRIAMLLYRQSKFKESADNFKSAYTNYFDCGNGFGDNYRIQEILNNIGLCYFKLNNFDSSIYYYNKSIVFLNSLESTNELEEKNIQIAKGVVLGNMAKAYLEKKVDSTAIILLNANININSKKGYNNYDALTSISVLAKYYLGKNNIKKYLETISKLDTIAYAMNNEDLQEIYNIKSIYFSDVNKHDSAYHYLLKYISIKDSLELVRKEIIDNNVLLSMQSLERENEINKLLKDKQLRDFYYFIVISFAVVLIIISGIVFYFLRVTNKKNKQLLFFNNEITKQKDLLKDANEEIYKNIEELNERETQKNKILSIVAHDLRNPNNAIVFMAEELKSSPNISEDEREMLELIESSAKSNNVLIHEILHTGKVGKLDSSNTISKLWLTDLMKQTLTLITHKAIEKNISLNTLNDCPLVELEIFTDKIKRAISNIVINAIKFSNKDSKIDISYSIADDFVSIHIRDYGIGIPDHIKPNLFSSDPSIKREGTAGEASFGLGLGIVKQIIEEHKGSLNFTSDTSGTEFIISLPISKQSI